MASTTTNKVILIVLILFAAMYYFDILLNDTSSDNKNILNDNFNRQRFLYWITSQLAGINAFRIISYMSIVFMPIFIYGATKHKPFAFVYSLFVLTYWVFKFYTTGHDSMIVASSLTFLFLWKRDYLSIIFLGAHRIEYMAVIILKNWKFIPIIILLAYRFSHYMHWQIFPMFYPYILNDWGILTWPIIIFGFIGVFQLKDMYLTYTMIWCYMWPFVYGDGNPRYHLTFFLLFYYISMYSIYLILIKIERVIGYAQRNT